MPAGAIGIKPSDGAEEALVASFGGIEPLLDWLKEQGCCAVELRNVQQKRDPATVAAAVALCRRHGLFVTIHGDMEDIAPAQFFAPYTVMFDEGRQETYNITLHGMDTEENTVRLLRGLLDEAAARQYPVTFTLENNRRKKGDTGYQCALDAVCHTTDVIGDKRLKNCWDMGHYYSNLMIWGADGQVAANGATVPTADLLSHVGHTHIHALGAAGTRWDGTRATHYPLDRGDLPLAEYVRGLEAVRYDGIYYLELSIQRYFGKIDLKDAAEASIRILREV